ncbi:hypothetical protein [Chamaesiphon sp.]|uniref:hypothetical protein n=1 Tax=Chamaesiphon sp. TaxID=2814140 RepID=UPI003593D19F
MVRHERDPQIVHRLKQLILARSIALAQPRREVIIPSHFSHNQQIISLRMDLGEMPASIAIGADLDR